MTTPVLDVRDLAKRFGAQEVLRGVDLAVMPAEHVVLAGNNGQGKTTLIRLVLGLLAPDAGEIRIEGRTVAFPRASAHKRAVGFLPESVSFYPNLTGWQTLRFMGRLKTSGGAGLRGEIERLLDRVGLTEAADRKVGQYSKGMRQRLGLAVALLGAPRLLLLDEPTNGLDPQGVHEFYNILGELQREGVAILTASHLLAEIEPRLDRLAVLRDGGISRSGTIAALCAEACLPTTLRFTLRDGVAALPAELERAGAVRIANGAARAFRIEAGDRDKFHVLAGLVRHAEVIDSLAVSEPGLEELFRRLNRPESQGPSPREDRE